MRVLRSVGAKAAVVERWNQYVGEHGIRQDLFGIIDILVLDPERGFIGIQCCAGSGFKAHWRKLTEDNSQACIDWLQTPGGKLEIWAWRKVKLQRGGKAERWSPRIKEITLQDFGLSLEINRKGLQTPQD